MTNAIRREKIAKDAADALADTINVETERSLTTMREEDTCYIFTFIYKDSLRSDCVMDPPDYEVSVDKQTLVATLVDSM